MRKKYLFIYIVCLLCAFCSCREQEILPTEETVDVTYPSIDPVIKGFYLLNEGNMGSNSATIDYFSYEMGTYHRNIYPSRNPSQVKELGDVGNDIQVYKDMLFAVINVSNYVEVMDLAGRHIKGIDIPNCRYIVFKDDKAYVSSYATVVSVDQNAGRGLVFEIDLHTLSVTRKVEVGYQPEQMAIINNKLYVANSGGYRAPNYDTTVSVVDLDSFQETKKIDVAINLHRLLIDNYGYIYVTSRGDNDDIKPRLYIIDTHVDVVTKELDVIASDMCLLGDSIYYVTSYEKNSGTDRTGYGIIDTQSQQVIADRIITDGTDKQIMRPYGLQINPETKEIYIADAQDYVVSGVLYCFSFDGKFQWKILAGNIPAHMVFIKSE